MMRRLLVCLAALISVAALPLSATSPSFVWKATAPSGGIVYLAGSVHLLSADYYPLAPAFDEAFAASDLLVEELDMGEMLSPNSQMKMLQRGMLPAGQTLDRLLSPETLKLVGQALSTLGMPFEPLKQFKTWMLAMTMQSLAWQKAGFDANLGLDKHFYDLAKPAGKKVQGLETMDYQLSRFDELPKDVQERMLVETAKEIGSTEQSFSKMTAAWKSGDASAVERQVLDDLKAEPEMYARLLLERNKNWIPVIEGFFNRPTPTFVVVGAAHLVGSEGIVQVLRAKGYTLTQM
ncbi:MAG: TraB/GumN family protein [Vicinamibacterales bacterium]